MASGTGGSWGQAPPQSAARTVRAEPAFTWEAWGLANWGAVSGGTEPWRKWGGCREGLQPPRRLREPGARAGREENEAARRGEVTRGVHGGIGWGELGPIPCRPRRAESPPPPSPG